MTFLETGILELSDLTVPSAERMGEGPVAIIECVQEIPCNPCVDSCKRGAITMGDSINNVPVVNYDKCNGCALCVANCPGLAIFIIDMTFEDNRALVGMPYEFLPLPEEGETVTLLNRGGDSVSSGEIIKVRNAKIQDRTPVIFIACDKEKAMSVRFFRRQ